MSPRRRGAHGFLYRVEVSVEAADIIRTLPPEVKRQIKQALVHLTECPGAGKPLTEELAGLHSYRARRFRIVYQCISAERRLLVLHVGHRKTVYEEISRRLKPPPLSHNE
jgi:mRNA interferase RelE/StbE